MSNKAIIGVVTPVCALLILIMTLAHLRYRSESLAEDLKTAGTQLKFESSSVPNHLEPYYKVPGGEWTRMVSYLGYSSHEPELFDMNCTMEEADKLVRVKEYIPSQQQALIQMFRIEKAVWSASKKMENDSSLSFTSRIF